MVRVRNIPYPDFFKKFCSFFFRWQVYIIEVLLRNMHNKRIVNAREQSEEADILR